MELLIGIAIGVVGMVVLYHGWGWVLALYHKYITPKP